MTRAAAFGLGWYSAAHPIIVVRQFVSQTSQTAFHPNGEPESALIHRRNDHPPPPPPPPTQSSETFDRAAARISARETPAPAGRVLSALAAARENAWRAAPGTAPRLVGFV